MSEPTKSLFDKLYDATEAAIKDGMKPFERKKLKGRVQSAHNDASAKKVEAEYKLEQLRQDIKNYDINEILRQKDKISTLGKLIQDIEQEYEILFGETIPQI